MGNKLEKQLQDQDLSRVGPVLNDVLNHCQKGNPKLNWLKIVSVICDRIIPLSADSISTILAEKPTGPTSTAASKKWQKRLDTMQVTLHTAGSVLANLGRLPPSVLQTPGFEAIVKTQLVPSLLRYALLDRGGFVTQELAAVLQRLPVAHETLLQFLAAWAKYFEDLVVALHASNPSCSASASTPQADPFPESVGVCQRAVEALVQVANDWSELDPLCPILLDIEHRPDCQLVLCKALAGHIACHVTRFENNVINALASATVTVIRHSIRVEGQEDLCLAALTCLKPLATSLSDSSGLLLCASRAFASPDDCWPMKQAIMECLAVHLQTYPAAIPQTLYAILVKALEATEPILAYTSVFTEVVTTPPPQAIATACQALTCVAAVAANPQTKDLLPYAARAALLYTDPCMPDALRCIGAMLKATPGTAGEMHLWRSLVEVVSDVLRVPPLGAHMPQRLRQLLHDAADCLSTEHSIPVVTQEDNPETIAVNGNHTVGRTSSTKPMVTDSQLIAYSLDFYQWSGNGFQPVVPAILQAKCPAHLVTALQEALDSIPVNNALQHLCHRLAACVALRISSTDDAVAAEHGVGLFLQVMQGPQRVRPWMDPDNPFAIRFGMQICAGIALQIVTGQRDTYLSVLKSEVAQLDGTVKQLMAEKAALVQKWEALQKQSEAARQLQQSLQCSVCLESLTENKPCALQCGHLFHLPCVEQVFRAGRRGRETCPLCRTSITLPPLPLKGLEE